MRRIISSHLDDIGRCHYQKVMRGLHLTKKELDECCQLLRSLSPYPANSFSTREYIHYIVPDAFILTIDNHLEIVMNDSRSPGFHENPYYVSLRETTDDPQVRQYLQEKIRQIRSVQNDIRQRSSTISRVLRVLVSRQEGFFLSGPGRKLPLSLKDIAAELELHESTVSPGDAGQISAVQMGHLPAELFSEPGSLLAP